MPLSENPAYEGSVLMLKRMVLGLLLTAVLAVAAGCGNDIDAKSEVHHEENTEEVLETHTAI